MLLRRADYLTRPWRNGGGVSHEIAWGEDEDWRLGLAEIDRDGPFSDYTGFDRTLTVVRGEGLSLNADVLSHAPYGFRGEEAVQAKVASWPVLVLNAITRRGRFAHEVRRLPVHGHLLLTGTSFVTSLAGDLVASGTALGPLDTWRLDDAEAELRGEGEVLAVTFRPA